ncbi:MAG: three-Cys-motif partner protein TcmP [Alphaproteobacteria bacterium]
MAQRRFGSADSTGRKLDVIEEYLSMYQKALSNTGFRTLYIDGFAGSGEIPLSDHKDGLFDEDVKTVMTGSAHRALNVSPAFSRYIFIDKERQCIDALSAKFVGNPNAGRVKTLVGDANIHVQNLCAKEQWHSQRGVVLLDPFGSQVNWSTIEAIASTKALDLWYLFPAGLGVFRQISKDGTVDPTHEPSITRIVGTEDWKTAFFKPSTQGDLFGKRTTNEKFVTPESATEFMIKRLKTVFQGGVLEEMIPLGKHAYPSYYLLFAWGNPSPKATALARKLAKAAVKATDRKHGRLV